MQHRGRDQWAQSHSHLRVRTRKPAPVTSPIKYLQGTWKAVMFQKTLNPEQEKETYKDKHINENGSLSVLLVLERDTFSYNLWCPATWFDFFCIIGPFKNMLIVWGTRKIHKTTKFFHFKFPDPKWKDFGLDVCEASSRGLQELDSVRKLDENERSSVGSPHWPTKEKPMGSSWKSPGIEEITSNIIHVFVPTLNSIFKMMALRN